MIQSSILYDNNCVRSHLRILSVIFQLNPVARFTTQYFRISLDRNLKTLWPLAKLILIKISPKNDSRWEFNAQASLPQRFPLTFWLLLLIPGIADLSLTYLCNSSGPTSISLRWQLPDSLSSSSSVPVSAISWYNRSVIHFHFADYAMAVPNAFDNPARIEYFSNFLTDWVLYIL